MWKKVKFQIPLKMKKIINKQFIYLLILFFVFSACKNKEKDKVQKSNEQILKEVNEVLGIGKVVPEAGWQQVSSTESGTIQEILVDEGDSITKNQVLIRLKPNLENLDVEEAKAALNRIVASNQIDVKDLEREEIKAKQLKERYDVSKRLVEKGAETQEVLNDDLRNWQVQEKLVSGLRAKLKANQASEQEQIINIKKSKTNLDNLQILASASGIITEWNAVLGESIQANSILGKIADPSHLIIEAEVDELFADRLALGQQVRLTVIGAGKQLATGKISYLSPTLSNKSILFESVKEGEDRRVRKIKITPDQLNNLIINAKVECHIKL